MSLGARGRCAHHGKHGKTDSRGSWKVKEHVNIPLPLYWHGLTLIPAWINNYIHEITYPYHNFNDATIEVWEWINDFTLHLTGRLTLIFLIHEMSVIILQTHMPLIGLSWIICHLAPGPDVPTVENITGLFFEWQQHMHIFLDPPLLTWLTNRSMDK